MRRGLLNRIHAIVEYDRDRTQGAWNLSDGVREALVQWVGRRETEIRMVEEAGPFTGEAPFAPGLYADGEGDALRVRQG
jgi:hypothetical protein